MKNRAKCKLCNEIIESFHSTDYVFCKCGEIAVDGGSALRCFASDWDNFLRVDDEGNEIVPTIQDISQPMIDTTNNEKLSKKELIDMLDEMIKAYDRLPQSAMANPVSNYDLVSALMLVSALFKA